MGTTLARAGLVCTVLLAALGAVLLWPLAGRAGMPCQLPNRGFDFDTFEPENYVAVYGAAIELATAGKAVTFAYTPAAGEPVDLRYQGLKSGGRASRTAESTANVIPPSVYKSIAWNESGWANAANQVLYGQVGPTLVSGDCGYGIGQITSGMGHLGVPPAREPGVPSARQAAIGTDPLFNIAAGVQILADKWNGAPANRPIAGNGDPTALEDWYYAIWSYNGFAFINHPLNPDRDPLRGAGTSFIFHCYDPSAPSYQDTGAGPRFQRGDYTYTELVYGCMRFPPKLRTASTAQLVADTTGPRFSPGDVAVVVGGGCTNLRSNPIVAPDNIRACLASGTRVTITGASQAGSGYLWWPVHTATNGDGWMADQFLAPAPPPGSTPTPTPSPTPTPVTGPPSGTPPVVDPTGRMWLPQVFNMPDFSKPEVAAAFAPANFSACENDGFSGGCPLMDFPTSFPQASPPVPVHHDTTPPTDPSWLGKLLGDPRIQFTGPTAASLIANGDGSATSVTVTVKNGGTWIAPFRVRTSDNWIAVRHPSDPPARTLDGGVAIGKETDVVLQPATTTSPRVAQKGYDSVLMITLDPALLPPGISTGTVWIEPLLGSGSPFKVTVTATNLSDSAGGKTYHVVAPAVASDSP